MGVKRCAYPRCKSDSRYYQREYMSGVRFFPFPKPISKPILCKKWLAWLKEARKDFDLSKINENTYICSKHFVEGNPNPIHDQLFLHGVDLEPGNLTRTVQKSIMRPKKRMSPIGKKTSRTIAVNQSMVSILKPISETGPQIEDVGLHYDTPLSYSVKESDIRNVDLRTNTLDSSGIETHEEQESIVEATDFTSVEQTFKGKGTENSFTSKFKDFLNTEEWITLEKMGWFWSLTDKRLELLTISDKTNNILIRLTVKPDNSYLLNVLNQRIEQHNLITLPEKIVDSVTILSVLNDLKKLNVCIGNGEDEVVQLLKERQRGHFLWNTASQHDDSCTRLTEKKICVSCSRLRNYALQSLSRRKKNQGLKYKSHSKEVLIEMLRQSKESEKNTSKKLKRLSQKVKKFIKNQEI